MTLKLRWEVLFIPLLLIIALAVIGVKAAQAPDAPSIAGLKPLPTVTPTVTPTPGWWSNVDYEATPALKKLPSLPRPQFGGGLGGPKPGKPIRFKTRSCPTPGVKITGVETGGGAWWHVLGVVNAANLWYWKIEASVDGKNWLHLYRQESPAAGLLSRVNLGTLPGRPAFFRLTAVDKTGNYPSPCIIQIQ